MIRRIGVGFMGLVWAFVPALGVLGCGAVDPSTGEFVSADSDEGDGIGTAEEAIVNGIATSAKPAIGEVHLNGTCTATAISPRHVLTAAHCNVHLDEARGAMEFVAGSGDVRTVSRLFIIGAEAPPGQAVPPGNTDFNPDVALLELATPLPATVIPIAVSSAPPAAGATVTWYGLSTATPGCVEQPGGGFADWGKKRRSFSFGTFTNWMCPGDSGGPIIHGSHQGNGAVYGVASFIGNDGDVWGNVSRYKEDIMSVIRMWNAGNSSGITGLEAGFQRNGVQTGSTTTQASASACRTLCNGTSGCNSFRFTHSTGACRLFKDAGDWTADPDSTSGLSSVNLFESNVDRPGNDYNNHLTGTQSECSLDCSNDRRCAAFSWVGNTGRCFLKEYLGAGVAATGIFSGTKRGFAYYTDRPGGDFTHFDVTPPDVRTCQTECSKNTSCLTYTYRQQFFSTVEPWGPTQLAHCWLKSSAPSPVTNVNEFAAGGFKRLISGPWKSTP